MTSRSAILETRRKIERECRLTVSLETANRELQSLASTDVLTKVASRSYFNEYLYREWKRLQKHQLSLALILCKIDFLQIDYQGKDEYLCHIADTMKKSKRRSTDFIARYSDEQFAMILANTQIEEAKEVIKAIQNSIESLNIHNEFLKINFGLTSMIPSAEFEPYQLIKDAESDLLINKEQLTIIN